MKRKFIYLTLCLALIICFVPNFRSIDAVQATNSSAKGLCVIEKTSGRIIYSKNEDMKLPMASTTKIVTAITVIENCQNLDEIIEVNHSCVGVEGTSIYLRTGETMSIRDLLYGLMLRSGNDSAVALACHVGGNVNGFAEMMNKIARKVGANNSNFTNPHGLHDDNHYTTAHDLALITAYALNNDTFKEIVSTKSHVIPQTNMSEKRYLTNKNKLLNTLEGCCGVKTGFTKKAGRCLVSACERENVTYVCVVLNCGPMFEESASMLHSCFQNYEYKQIIDKNKEIYNEYSIDDKNGRLYLYADEDFYYPIKADDELKLEYSVKLNNAQRGDNVGEIKIFVNKHLKKTVKLFTMNKIDKLIDSKTLQISEILWEEMNENK